MVGFVVVGGVVVGGVVGGFVVVGGVVVGGIVGGVGERWGSRVSFRAGSLLIVARFAFI